MKESLCCCLLFDKVVHPHSLNKFSNDTDLVDPVTRRAASFWIFCKVCESCSEHQEYPKEPMQSRKSGTIRVKPRVYVRHITHSTMYEKSSFF